jgi:hypothetical protein
MTICVAVKVHDCLVFAADSASSISFYGPGAATGIRRVYSHGNKVFNLFKKRPICAMTAGLGNIGPLSISTVAKDFRAQLVSGAPEWKIDPDNYTIGDIAEKARLYLLQEMGNHGLANQPLPTLHFWVGGFSSGEGQSELWEVAIVNGACPTAQLKMDKDVCGIELGGQPEALYRLVLGYSPSLPDVLQQHGITGPQVGNALAALANHPDHQIVEPAMPTQDAVALAEFLAETVKGYVRFSPGPDTVGGPTDVAAVTKHEGFKWVKRKHYYDPGLNPLETDHA